MAKDNSADPLALTLAGWVLRGKDTPESIRLLELAKAKAPNFPWPAEELAGDYFGGKRADPDKVKENVKIFFSICPASTDSLAQWLLNKDPELQPSVAVALRARLEKETDPKRLEDFATLWGLEFRTRPPAEHDAVRAQVARDLKRLEELNRKGNSEWQAFIINGYKQGGASKEAIIALEDQLIREYPHSSKALQIVQERWDKTHKEPDQNDTAAWAKRTKEYEDDLKGWIRDYPDDQFLQRYAWFYAIQDDDTVQEKDGIAAVDAFLHAVTDFERPDDSDYLSAARFLLEHGWQPARALDLVKEQRVLGDKSRARRQDDDNLSDEDLKNGQKQEIWQKQDFDELTLKAARQANRPEEALKLRASIEMPPPTDKELQSGYWFNRARLEVIENHRQDALAYYQLALQTRVEQPKAWHGKLRDDLTDEEHALWKQQGGTEVAWAVWSNRASGSVESRSEGYWEKATKPIPSFELSDLSGKTWRLKDLAGKTLVINLWATWCGPCQAELPHLQKFYEKVKDRPDLQVLTFDIDEQLGLVAPYLKEKGYTFPVLPAYSTVVSLLDGFAIPQTWLVDPQGAWRWKQMGYGGGSDADFEKEMLARLESMKTTP